MDPQLRNMATQTLYYALPEDQDEAGQVQVGDVCEYPCRIEASYREHSFINRSNEERTSHRIILDPDFPATARQMRWMLVWLPWDDPEEDNGRRLKRIDPMYDEFGQLAHWELLC